MRKITYSLAAIVVATVGIVVASSPSQANPVVQFPDPDPENQLPFSDPLMDSSEPLSGPGNPWVIAVPILPDGGPAVGALVEVGAITYKVTSKDTVELVTLDVGLLEGSESEVVPLRNVLSISSVDGVLSFDAELVVSEFTGRGRRSADRAPCETWYFPPWLSPAGWDSFSAG